MKKALVYLKKLNIDPADVKIKIYKIIKFFKIIKNYIVTEKFDF